MDNIFFNVFSYTSRILPVYKLADPPLKSAGAPSQLDVDLVLKVACHEINILFHHVTIEIIKWTFFPKNVNLCQRSTWLIPNVERDTISIHFLKGLLVERFEIAPTFN